MLFTKLLHSCINVLFSADCPTCGIRPAGYPLPICRDCEKELIDADIPPPASSAHVTRISSCLPYSGTAKEAIKQFKYYRRRTMIRAFEETMRRSIAENTLPSAAIDLALPVPIHKTRRRERGFNQAEVIAKVLSAMLSVPVSSGNLVKTKNTAPQTGLTRKRRINNLKGSFSVPDPAGLAGKTILLVDDVMTTGATLDACAAELLQAGAKSVMGFTLARRV